MFRERSERLRQVGQPRQPLRVLDLPGGLVAIEKGRTLLVLDTASEEGAAGLYERLGFTLAGEIPDFALKPYGGLTGTLVYWKRIGRN